MNNKKPVQIAIKDLMFRSRVINILDRIGQEHYTTTSADEITEAVNDKHPRLVVLDLSLPGVDTIKIISNLCHNGNGSPRPAVVAYTNHTLEDKLYQARDAGADLVISNGTFASRMPQILAQFTDLDVAEFREN